MHQTINHRKGADYYDNNCKNINYSIYSKVFIIEKEALTPYVLIHQQTKVL